MNAAGILRRLTLRRKLIALIFLVSALASTTGLLVEALTDLRNNRIALKANADVIARTVATYSVPDLLFDDPTAARETIAALADMTMVEQAFIVDARGSLFVSLHPGAPATMPVEAAGRSELRDGRLLIAEPIRSGGRLIGTLHLVVSTAKLDEDAERQLLTLALILAAVLAISLVLSVWLQGVVSEPIRRLAESARRVSRTSDFSERVNPPSADDIGSLYQAFNTMLGRIQDNDRARAAAFAQLAATHESMRESEQELGAIIEMLPLVVTAKDAGNLRYVRFNRAAEVLYGIPRERIVGKRDEDVFPADKAAANAERDREALRVDGVVNTPEETVHTPLGPRVLHTRTVVVRAADGAPRYLLGIAEDITARKAAEAERERIGRQLQQAQKMEAIGQLSGGIAHDFNNILTSILGYASMASMLVDGVANARLAGYLDQVLRGGERGRDLVRTILSYARGSGGKSVSLPVESHITDIMHMLSATIPASITWTTRIEPGLPPVMSDPVHLQQVLSNLVVNARDALQDRGNIDVELALRHHAHGVCSTCNRDFEGDYVELAVRDDGPGIPPAHLDRLFIPFFTTKDVGKGTGLGLAMVHSLVHDHGGHIGVESAAGRGAVFRVWWRVSGLAGESGLLPPPAQDDPPAAAHAAARLVVVDDEASVAALIADFLRGHGYAVDAFTDAREALAFVAAQGPAIDLLITDQNMPELSGVELVQALQRGGGAPPVLLLSGHSELINADNHARFGIRAYLAKPFDLATLLAGVKTALGGAGRKDQQNDDNRTDSP